MFDHDCVYCSRPIGSADHNGSHIAPMHSHCQRTFDHEYAALLDDSTPQCIDCLLPITDWDDLRSTPAGVHHADCLSSRRMMLTTPTHGDADWIAIAHDQYPRMVALVGDDIGRWLPRFHRLASGIESTITLLFPR